MIQHAFKCESHNRLSRLTPVPNVKRIVYSTCSIHAEEDERVVARALKSGGGKWRLASRSSVLPSWERRGRKEELGADADSVIRCLPEDKTNGFFVSCFERVEGAVTKPASKKAKASATKPKAEASDKKAKDSLKRPRDEVEEQDEDAADDEDEPEVDGKPKEVKPKTAAQLERARRKKKSQKKKQKVTA